MKRIGGCQLMNVNNGQEGVINNMSMLGDKRFIRAIHTTSKVSFVPFYYLKKIFLTFK